MSRNDEGSFVPASLTQLIVQTATEAGFAADTDVSCRYVEQSVYIEAEIGFRGKTFKFLFPHDVDQGLAVYQVMERIRQEVAESAELVLT